MTINRRILIASLISPIAILLVPAVVSFLSFFAGIGKGIDPMDDAPQRSAALFLFIITPIAYPLLAVSVFLLTLLLQKLRLFLKKVFIALVLVSSVILGILFGIQSPFGVKDQLIGVGVFFCFFALSLGLGALVLWLLMATKHNHGMQRIAEKTGSR